MKNFACFGRILDQVSRCTYVKISCLGKSFGSLIMACFCRLLVVRLKPFWSQLCYFLSFSLVGFLVLKVLKPRTNSFTPNDIDLLFMSVSSVTVSSMSTVEMEVFSNTQLVFMTILMLLGGEVFISMLGIQFQKSKLRSVNLSLKNIEAQIELGLVPVANIGNEGLEKTDLMSICSGNNMRYRSLRYLGYVVVGYLLVVLLGGYILVIVYLSLVASAADVLKKKGLHLHTFSAFTIVSTFTNCGFVPTNENMIVFKNNPALLLILTSQLLLGNTLYPSCLRLVIWVLERLTRREEFRFMLKYTKEMGYSDLFPSLHSLHLVFTVFGLILVQLLLFCCMEWNSEALDGMSSYQKIIGALFQSVNSRHGGETIVDLSIISPAVLVLFGFMMYLPAYTTFSPVKVNDDDCESSCDEKGSKQRGHVVDNLLFSQLSYLVILVALICITERKKLKDDPLNFNVFNIAIEVVSAYGNVGFTTGYSCKRQINHNSECRDTWYGFSGRWSSQGKIILIVIMFFGRLKKFSMGRGRAWKLF